MLSSFDAPDVVKQGVIIEWNGHLASYCNLAKGGVSLIYVNLRLGLP